MGCITKVDSLYTIIIIVESYLGQPVKNAVVTVPAYFNDSQRQVRVAHFMAYTADICALSDWRLGH